ncbi:dipeptidase PepE [Chitinophaga sp. sic0106]|uniref:dipeptidase PepE n=1 Tax=Chitinophaga sp. sic0106 TaxID=2854785 RepID=UPI001C44B607|nr:dipeptidase PepE [Chitinophaga sp. sic0106]MBV7531411.1 dipeptidase PepE [Chitinophaga sp. sic0106]
MRQIVLASTSTLFGEEYLAYLKPTMKDLFAGVTEIIFIPYARPGGISHDDYTARAAAGFNTLGISVKGLHTFDNPAAAVENAKGIFTGGGNTFLLVKTLHEQGLMPLLKTVTDKGTPYMGCSAGTNIGGVSMKTTNDMPIVYPSSFVTAGMVPFNINPHYLDPIAGNQHMGETRETRIREFHTQNSTPVVGLREGSWIRLKGAAITLEGTLTARIFEQGKEAYEVATGTSLEFLK